MEEEKGLVRKGKCWQKSAVDGSKFRDLRGSQPSEGEKGGRFESVTGNEVGRGVGDEK